MPKPLAPGPAGIPFLGNLSILYRSPLELIPEAARQYGDVVRLRFGPVDYHVVSDLDAVKHVLIDNHRNYVKSRNYRGLKLVLGQGLVTSEGEFWQRQRRLSQPSFLRRRIASFAEPIVRQTEELALRLRERRGPIDMHAQMTALAYRIVGETLFGVKLDVEESQGAGPKVKILLDYINDFVEQPVFIHHYLPTRRRAAFLEALQYFDDFIYGIIRERRAAKARPPDLLTTLMEASEGEHQMSDRQLRDEIITLMAAGHETTANAIAFTFYFLSRFPLWDRRVEDELSEVLGDRMPTVEDLPKLSVIECVIKESMRLLPPIWAFERDAIEADELGGYRLSPGSTVGIFPYLIHRDPRFWQNPEGFDPDRFLKARTRTRARCTYLPFAAGPRQCIGMGMAMMEAILIVATLRQHFRFSLQSGYRLRLKPSVTLRPDGPLWMYAHSLCENGAASLR